MSTCNAQDLLVHNDAAKQNPQEHIMTHVALCAKSHIQGGKSVGYHACQTYHMTHAH